jgi:hypothetical protein
MTAVVERDAVSELAVQAGWQRRESDRDDYYSRRPDRVRVIWRGDEAISGGALYRDGVLMAVTSELDTVKSWLKR